MSPRAPARPCPWPSGCPVLVDGGGLCRAHRKERARQRGSATAQGYGKEWNEIRRAYLAANPWCSWEDPKCDEAATDVDHKVPRAQGGSDDWENLQGFCHPHHSTKTATQDGGFGRAPRDDTA